MPEPGIDVIIPAYQAERWLGAATRNPTAWLVALSPGLVYWTATPHTMRERSAKPHVRGSSALNISERMLPIGAAV